MKRLFPLLISIALVTTILIRYGGGSPNLDRHFRGFDLSDQSPVAAMPGSWTYEVRRGDTLSKIAERNGLTTQELLRANRLENTALLLGQPLTTPSDDIPVQAGTGQTSRARIDVEMMAKLIRAEAEAEPYTGQVAVGAVLMNRVESPKFPNTLAGVIYQPHAFESVSNGTFNKPPTDSCRKAAQAAIQGWDPSGGALFFFNPSKTSNAFIWSRKIIQRIGHHFFSL